MSPTRPIEAAPALDPGWASALDARSLLFLQGTAGNAAVASALARPVSVQLAKTKKKKKGNTKSTINRVRVPLKRRIKTAMKYCNSNKLYNKLLDIDEFLNDATLIEVQSALVRFNALVNANHMQLNMAAAPHPAGMQYCDPHGNLIPPYQGNVRASFYPTYNGTALQAKATWLANSLKPNGKVRCKGDPPYRPAHDEDPINMTIDHVVSVCQHWNTGYNGGTPGRNDTRAARGAFFSDVNNHEYVCGPCNSSMGGGGYYNQTVGLNFRN
jgi:hypothetical protein